MLSHMENGKLVLEEIYRFPNGMTENYRDDRTKDIDKAVYEFISETELYTRTSIQKQSFKTIYQLMAVKKQNQDIFAKAKTMLMIPDYFHFLSTGKKAQEYTNATTTQLVNAKTKDWDYQLIDRLGYPQELFLEIKNPGYELGELTKAILGAVKTSVYIYMVSVITVVTSALILHEKITGLSILGTLLTLTGLFLSESRN